MANEKDSNNWTIFGSIGAAVAAAICCLGPLLLVSLGVTGAWIGNLSAMEPYRPLFIVLSALLLGLGFYRVYGREAQAECGEEGEECEAPRSRRINEVSLWIATIVVLGLFAASYLVPLNTASARQSPALESSNSVTSAETRVVTLEVEKMTCSGCTSTVDAALRGVPGVVDAHVTFEPPRARVTYSPDETNIDSLTRATSSVGYPSHPTE